MLFSGRASGKIVPTEAGRYLLRAEISPADPCIAVYLRVRRQTAGPEAGSETVEIIPTGRVQAGRKSCRKDQVPLGRKLLIGVETFRVVHSSVYDIKANTEISFKVTDEMAPNAWITAQVIEKEAKNVQGRTVRTVLYRQQG